MRRPTHETCAALAAAIDAYIEKAEGEDLSRLLERAGYIYVPETMQEAKDLEQKVSGVLSRSMLDRLKELQAAGGFNWLGILAAAIDGDPNMRGASADQYVLELYEALRGAFLSLMPKLVMGYSAKIDDKLAIEGITKRTIHFVDTWSRDLAEKMQLTTDTEIKRILDKALRDGDSIETVTQQIINAGIRGRSDNKSNPLHTDWRAKRVALTEMLRAHSYAQLDAYRQNPAVTGKRWMHTAAKFSTARPNHVAMDGTVVGVNEKFEIKGGRDGTCYADCPRDRYLPPSESVNCHCLIQPVVDEDILGLPLEERDRLWKEAVEADNGNWKRELDKQKQIESMQFHGLDTTQAEAELAEIQADIARDEARFKSADLTDEQQEALAARFNRGTADARRVYDKYVPPGTAIRDAHYVPKKPGDAKALFHPVTNGVYMEVNDESTNVHGPWSTYFHEHGHYIDYNAGAPTRGYNRYVSQNTQEYIDALRADVKAREQAVKKKIGGRVGDARFEIGGELRQKGDVTHGVADIYGGVVGSYYPGAGWGHTARYWKTDRDATLAHEAFANMFEAQFDPEKMRLMEQYLPTSWAKFNEMLKGLAHD